MGAEEEGDRDKQSNIRNSEPLMGYVLCWRQELSMGSVSRTAEGIPC